MITKNSVILSPQQYLNERGVLKKITELIEERAFNSPVIMTDKQVKQAVKGFVDNNLFVNYTTLLFKGNCTFTEIGRLTEETRKGDVLLALGGGQLLDTAKCVANNLKIPLISIPTLPSNCACITTKSIVYSEKHEMLSAVRHSQSVDTVLVEPELLRQAPYQYFLSGIGDTLAKWYEIRRRIPISKTNKVILEISRKLIEICKEQILKVDNLKLLDEEELKNLLDTIFLVAASVDGMAGLNGRSVAAHSFYNGYIKACPGYHKTHGEIVAVGILFQLTLEKEFNVIKKLVSFYHKLGLPTTLAELNFKNDKKKRAVLANVVVAKDNTRMRSVFPDISVKRVFQALDYLEEVQY
ncbi:iron-containing alcohol dehydrogenase family protein [Liquorilactobacillus uvarum]|uniref:Glycerol dehydrogenase n=1 Tax=Liquorilactobacillus uvarum DSM 19971 TaxID=1423812 RepID=A0A0R1Q2W8_9LACO|nr:iron-containing alcohol dehydrogenase family protein [Liquorilactobacillus uvarum]KRL38998.1 3-dehydroquinate synthase [Liquorilactobacillus uvarum DSM 19971]